MLARTNMGFQVKMADRDLSTRPTRRFLSVAVFTALAFVAAYLLTRHSGHLWQFLPYTLLLLCPLMHLLGHRHRH